MEGYEYQCQACDAYGPVDDLGLCEGCGARFERDMVRRRDWEYSAMAFGVPEGEREKLRDAVIRDHGPDLELLAEEE